MRETATPLWTFSDYVKLAEHKSPRVQAWADEQLSEIKCWHEIGSLESLAEWLQSDNQRAAMWAAQRLGDLGASECAPLLLKRFETAQGIVAAACGAALAKFGCVEAVPKLVARLEEKTDLVLFGGCILALGRLRTEQAYTALRSLVGTTNDPDLMKYLFESLLRYQQPDDVRLIVEDYLSFNGEPEDRLSLLDTLCKGAAVHEVKWDLRDLKKGESLTDLYGGAGQAAKRLGLLDRSMFNMLIEKKRYADLIGRVTQKAREVPVGQSRYHQLLGSFMQAFTENLSGVTEGTLEPLSLFLTACLVRLHEDVPEWSPQDPTERLVNILYYEGALPLEDELLEQELPSRGADAAELLLEVLKSDGIATERAATALGFMREARAVPRLLECLEDEDDDTQAYELALKLIGSPVVTAAEAVLKDDDVGQKISLLEVLSKIPVEESVSLLLNHYDDLLREIPDMLLMALEDLGSRRAIPLIERDIGKEEFDFDHAFLLLCELHGTKHPMLTKLRADIERVEQRTEAAMDRAETEGFDALLADDPGPLRLKLKCRACSRVYTYEIEEVFVNPDEKKRKDSPTDSAFFFRERIVCKNCGAEDDYSFTNEAMLMLTVEIVRLDALMKQGSDPAEVRSRVKMIEFGLQDGTRCTPREAVEIYKRRIAADPKDPELYTRLANVYTFLHRYDDAMTHYRQALAIDPDHLLTFFHLANAYGMMGQEQKAIRTMEEFLNRAARKPRLTPLERECFEEAKEAFGLPDEFEDVMFVSRKGKPLHRLEGTPTKGYLTAKPTPPSFTSAKPNQFCPCGSGKKYKKCCMSKT